MEKGIPYEGFTGSSKEQLQTLLPFNFDEPGQEPMKTQDFPPLPASDQPLMFADLFAGCGGLSLGLSLSGMNGVFAIERDKMAFSTLSANLLEGRKVPVNQFSWPSWLEKKAWAIDEVLEQHPNELTQLRGKVHVLAGGPPCQGFSFAGKRNESDPRNKLFEKYVEMVQSIRPSALVLENVPGMKVAHAAKKWKQLGLSIKPQSYYEKLVEGLDRIGYEVLGKIVDSSRFGVPQKRPRLIVIGLRKDLAQHLAGGVARAFELLEDARIKQLHEFQLPEVIHAEDAISDMEIGHGGTRPCNDPDSPKKFEEIAYTGPRTAFQRLMHLGCDGTIDSLRLARHRPEIKARFRAIIDDPNCAKGVRMNAEIRQAYGLKKHRIYPMQASAPAPTITTLPDDVLHYKEPRILTVRESARLQSFPDWFQFRGKFTTGGSQRTKECPRYTQVGNAVPPYLARAVGMAIKAMLDEAVMLASQQAERELEEKMIAIA
ncbi:DNA cytosine methyltransferase [Stutzerimonas stutzeri]|jgi:DNA (cytosine-5)-methyltransferase 1|uniref:DNA cytosine methyltransferase n=1 Tax=Stutzerimonas stutzeri TaxID=316 RepID=UPI00244AD235|nr:DNA cytosine methyltransferase [Stutzerimonas stutzeri]MDH1543060.1 DNA cytosine methyltransferase [Stutzerimonas stutzeri]